MTMTLPVLQLGQRLRTLWSGETDATYFNPYSSRQMHLLLDPLGVPLPTTLPTSAEAVRRVFEARVDLREAFPLALTPAGRRDFAMWLFTNGRPDLGLTNDDILGFLNRSAADPSHGLAETWLLTPSWQQAVPHGLTIFGWDRLREWVSAKYHLWCRWLRKARRPNLLRPWDEVQILRQFIPRPVSSKRKLWVACHPQLALRANTVEPTLMNELRREVSSPIWLRELRADIANGLPDRVGVNLLAHFRYPSGLQEEAVQYAAAIAQNGGRVSLRDAPVGYPRDSRTPSCYLGPELFDITLAKTGACESFDEQYAAAGWHPRSGVYRIACWSWELEQFPSSAAGKADLIDEIWAPSEFCGRAIRAAMPGKPVIAMLPAVAVPDIATFPRDSIHLPMDRFLFLFMFDMGSVMERKNPLGLIRAFQSAFRADDRVHLAIKITRGDSRPDDLAKLRAQAQGKNVTIIDQVMTRADAHGLMASCDAYVSLHRAEGFGFTVAEAMLMGKPTIATNYSANVEFMTAETSLPVDYRLVPVGVGNDPYPAESLWAEPDINHAAERMRWVYDHADDAKEIGERAKRELPALLSPEVAGRRMIARLAVIRQGRR